MSVRVVVATGHTGGGHFAQAEAFAAALASRARVEVIDALPRAVLRVHRPTTRNRLSRALYGLAWQASNSPAGARALRLLTPERGGGEAIPPFDVALSTHPLLVTPLVRAARENGGRVVCWCPEMGRSNNHALYTVPPLADYFLFGHQAGIPRFVDDLGVPSDRTRWCGFPLRAPFWTPRGQRRDHRAALGLDPHRPLVLLTAGGEGTGPVLRFLGALAARPRLRDTQLAVACGRNDRLRARLTQAAPRTNAFGYLPAEGMRDLIGAADVVCGLSCGVTQIMEATLFGRAPFIAVDSLEGQERENEGLLGELGIGAACRAMAEAARLVEEALATPQQFTPGMDALAALHADAPRRAADAVLEAVGGW